MPFDINSVFFYIKVEIIFLIFGMAVKKQNWSIQIFSHLVQKVNERKKRFPTLKQLIFTKTAAGGYHLIEPFVI